MKIAAALAVGGILGLANSIFGWWTVTPASTEAAIFAVASILVLKIEKRT